MPIIALVFLSLVAFVAGLVLLRRLRWQGEDHWVCARCGYDLRARGPSCVRCPECGTTLGDKSLQRASHRIEEDPRRQLLILLTLLVGVLFALCAWASVLALILWLMGGW